jgi:glutathione S-transferase
LVTQCNGVALITLWGFDGSTYVRSVKMLLAEKAFTDFEQVPLNVLRGEPKSPEHLQRHPFGKVPVLDHDGIRILETAAITRYLNDVLPVSRRLRFTCRSRRTRMCCSTCRVLPIGGRGFSHGKATKRPSPIWAERWVRHRAVRGLQAVDAGATWRA